MDLDDILNPVEDRTEDYAFFVGIKVAAETLGLSEGQFAAPLEQVVQALAAVVSHEFRLSQEYTFYAEMLRGLDRGALSGLFTELSYDERRDAEYFLRRISALMPGGVQLPPVPTPQPFPDALAILDAMIASEQQGILMLRQLRELAGENPMRFEIEQRLADEQKHLDRLWQHKPVVQPKVAFARESFRLKWANLGLQEQSMAFEQAKNENAFLQDQLAQTRDQLLAATEQSEQAGAQAAQAQEQVQQAVAQADMAQQDALAGQTAAAEQANAKLRLAQRIQQMRQTLADLAAQDPVAEEGVGVDPTMTTTQADQAAQQMQQDPAAQQDPTQQIAPQPGPSGAPQGQGATNITVKAASARDKLRAVADAVARPGHSAIVTSFDLAHDVSRLHPRLNPIGDAVVDLAENLDRGMSNDAYRALGVAGTAGLMAVPPAAYALGKHQGRKDVTTAQQDPSPQGTGTKTAFGTEDVRFSPDKKHVLLSRYQTANHGPIDQAEFLEGIPAEYHKSFEGITHPGTEFDPRSVHEATVAIPTERLTGHPELHWMARDLGILQDAPTPPVSKAQAGKTHPLSMGLGAGLGGLLGGAAGRHLGGGLPTTLAGAGLGAAVGGAAAHALGPKTAASPLSQAAANLAKKVRPTQAIPAVTPMAAAKHMAAHNPALAVQAGRQGAPVVASPSVLEELSRTSFGKLSTGAPQNPTVGQR